MALREKQCPYCNSYFFYDDNVDSHGVGISRKAGSQGNKIVASGHCPRCIDPHEIPGEAYKKKSVLTRFRDYLERNEVDTSAVDDEILGDMLQGFPRAYSYYNSNGNFRTFNVQTGERFSGKYDDFEIGPLNPDIHYMRSVRCTRCGNIAWYNKTLVLDFFLGLREKVCRYCDPRDYSHLNRGSKRSEFSARALAKALNVSRNDFLRHEIIAPEPPLSVGTMINGLEIVKAWWDEDPKSYSPKYRLRCNSCKQEFVSIQKRAHLMDHFCVILGRYSKEKVQ